MRESTAGDGGDDDTMLCPSAQCEPGAILLGVVGADGLVGFVTPQVTIDDRFVEVARQGRVPEKRFRFSQPCVMDACRHWAGARCGVIDGALEEVSQRQLPRPREASLPRCSIRPQCRWFAQNGRDACSVCPLVITDLRTVPTPEERCGG